jgi:23S rRNA pseudouridine2605 synthase
MRLGKYIADCGVASRRSAERIVSAGRVHVDGERVTDPARDVTEENLVTVDGQPVAPAAHEYYMLNKPAGVVSTAHDPEGRPKVTDLVRSEARLYPVGRLDADTTGVILLTNDGELANRLTHPRFEVEKAYRARVEGSVGEPALGRLRRGVRIEHATTAPARVTLLRREPRTTVLELVIHEGRKRQVRRMFEAIGHPVLELVRVRFGPLDIDDLPPGGSRPLEPSEVELLKHGGDRKTAARRKAPEPPDR